MEWQHPEWLYLILPLAAAWFGLSLYSRRCRRRAAEAFVAQAMWSRILPADSPARFWSKLILREVAIIAWLIALAGPRYGTLYEDVVPRGSDLYVLIDVSRSMLADDVPPSRLERAKADVAALVNRLEGERVGLIAFAGQAVVKCPLTVDYDAFRRSLDELDPGSAPRGGTAIGDAIRKALEVFQARAERDQAILLITDGDDQQSYPLEAAAVAAERHVTIFTVGLGDADQGARVPQAGATPGAGPKSFVEYEGQQVWSKLDNKLLKEIALATSGVYVPVGTRAYDLGALYAEYLQGRRGGEGDTRKRLRRAEQFQIFLAVALLVLIADLFVRPYSAPVLQSVQEIVKPGSRVRTTPATSAAMSLLLCALLPGVGRAENPAGAVREGLQHYRADEFEKAREKFAAAREEFRKDDAPKAAIAAFDEACAAHRKGDVSQAREAYLQAGLAHDKSLAAAAHFNLGTLSAEEARRLAGERPETVPPEKRQEILDQLKGAVASFRHSLELQPSNARARRDIELVRQWIKYYSEKWHEQDRQKRRQEANLVAFLEFLIETQRGLRESVRSLPPTAPADAYAELKRLQEELAQEIPPLKEKIRADLQPQQAAPAQPGGQPGVKQPGAGNTEELEQGLKLLEGWAEAAGEKMTAAVRKLDSRRPEPATVDQQGAQEELEKIWEAVVPFSALLARDLVDQTSIAGELKPAESADSEDGEKEAPGREPVAKNEIADLKPLTELQEQTQRRTHLLKLKAEAELERLEKSPPPTVGPKATPKEEDDNSPKLPDEEAAHGPQPVDPAQLKAGLEKAIELAPRAADQMETALKALRQDDQSAAYPPAEEARKILEEIQKAQPKQDQQDQQKQDQQKQEEKQDEEKKPEEEKQDEQKTDEKKKDEQKKDEKQDEQKQDKEAGKKPQPQVSRDQIEEALRKVRERQQDKRERDRKMKARMSGRAPVEKDW